MFTTSNRTTRWSYFSLDWSVIAEEFIRFSRFLPSKCDELFVIVIQQLVYFSHQKSPQNDLSWSSRWFDNLRFLNASTKKFAYITSMQSQQVWYLSGDRSHHTAIWGDWLTVHITLTRHGRASVVCSYLRTPSPSRFIKHSKRTMQTIRTCLWCYSLLMMASCGAFRYSKSRLSVMIFAKLIGCEIALNFDAQMHYHSGAFALDTSSLTLFISKED